MKILVTGATGFLGTAIIEELLREGGHELIATSAHLENARAMPWFSQVKFVSFDIQKTKDEDFFSSIENFGCPDRVIHSAWKNYKATHSLHHLDECIHHYYFIEHLFERGVRDFTIVGTAYEYGLLEGCLTEDKVAPVTAYGVSKNCLHQMLQIRLAEKARLRWVRPFNLFGSRQHPYSLLGQLQQALDRRDKVFAMSQGKQRRDFLPIKTAAAYISKIAQQTQILGAINCCSGKPISILEMVERQIIESGQRMELSFTYPYSRFEPMEAWGDRRLLDRILSVELT